MTFFLKTDALSQPASYSGVPPMLLLVPASLMRQWESELHQWGAKCIDNFKVGQAHASKVDDVLGNKV